MVAENDHVKAVGCTCSRRFLIWPTTMNNPTGEELRSHINLLLGREPTQRTLEDLEDYYERALQVRQMNMFTLQEQLREAQEERDAHLDRADRLAHRFWMLGLAWAAFVLLVVRTARPVEFASVLAVVGVALSWPPVAVALSAAGTWVAIGKQKTA